MKAGQIDLPFMGSPDEAKLIALRVAARVPAYRSHLGGVDINTVPWRSIPQMDKEDYLSNHAYRDVLADNVEETYAVFSSSGSSGKAFYWPQLRGSQRNGTDRLRSFLELSFGIRNQRTMAIVGLSMGSWIGGEHFSWVLKNVAVSSSYPFSVLSPGNQHDEIISMIHSLGATADQILLVVCPSAIGHLRLLAEEQKRPLPLAKLRFLVVGEPFPESLRTDLSAHAKLAMGMSPILSLFGSADTGTLGGESSQSAIIRGLLEKHAEQAKELGFEGPAPHLFHFANASTYLECVDGELCVTKWQGIPLVRYNLHDSARLISWEALVRAVTQAFPIDDAIAKRLLSTASFLPDILAVSGRTDRCLMLCGTKLTEAMLDQAIGAEGVLKDFLTGTYRASVVQERERQRLELTLEYKAGDMPRAELEEKLYPLLIQSLGNVQSEFKQDWEHIYRRWDGDTEKRILSLKLMAWPCLSGDGSIKQRGIAH